MATPHALYEQLDWAKRNVVGRHPVSQNGVLTFDDARCDTNLVVVSTPQQLADWLNILANRIHIKYHATAKDLLRIQSLDSRRLL